MDNLWSKIESEIAKRPHGAGREVAWLASKLGTTVQRVNNWKLRGVPHKAYEEIAQALGWSLDALAGTERPINSVWPFELVSREKFAALTPVQRGVVESAMLDALAKLDSIGPSDLKANQRRFTQ